MNIRSALLSASVVAVMTMNAHAGGIPIKAPVIPADLSNWKSTEPHAVDYCGRQGKQVTSEEYIKKTNVEDVVKTYFVYKIDGKPVAYFEGLILFGLRNRSAQETDLRALHQQRFYILTDKGWMSYDPKEDKNSRALDHVLGLTTGC